MQSSYWGYWLVVLGVAIVGLMISVQGITTTSTQDYLSIKEITEASMLEAVDYGYYRDYNEVKMNKEKFFEVFIRMLSENMGATDTYEVNFYGVYEAPPKVSVEILSNSGTNFITNSGYDTVTKHSAIIQIYAEEVSTGSSRPGNGNVGGGTTTTTPNNPPADAKTCQEGINKDSTDIIGTHGISLAKSANDSYSNVYKTLDEVGKKESVIGNVYIDGGQKGKVAKKFEILGESADSQYLAIKTSDIECGWVRSDIVAVNLRDYLRAYSNMGFNITNANASLMTVFGGTPNERKIPNVTGQKLYDSSLSSFVALNYSYAKKIRDVVKSNSNHTFTIYDAYRPFSVSSLIYDNVSSMGLTVSSSSACKQNILNCYPKQGGGYVYMTTPWYINKDSTKGGTHNRLCAIDVTIDGKETTYSRMHELSYRSNKYMSQGYKYKTDSNFTPEYQNNSDVQELHRIMMAPSGVRTISSEWWHFEDETCLNSHNLGGYDFTSIQ